MTLTCRTAALEAGEPLPATAPYARGWIVIEVPGAWGRKALHESGLDTTVARLLAERAEGSATTVLLARRPGRTVERGSALPRRVWVAHTSPGGVRMRVGQIADDHELLELDPEGIAAGASPGYGERSTSPVLFVCANGKRDACCALEGGPVARELAATAGDDQVWECSHLGGHRFAATALLLPWGTVHGRLTADSARELLSRAADGDVPLDTYRGRTSLPRWLQAAEHAVRAACGITGIDSLDVLRVVNGRAVPETRAATNSPSGPIETEVRSDDGRAWRVVVQAAAWSNPRIESCTGSPVEGVTWGAISVTAADSWR